MQDADYNQFIMELSFIMAQRLKLLREEKGLSHDRLSKALFDQFGAKISADSLINYEVADPNHSKAGKNKGMRVEYLRVFADFYGVSSDYILGLTDVRKQDLSVRKICEFTGLSEKVITHLSEQRQDKSIDSATRNFIFENRCFHWLVESMVSYYHACTAHEMIMKQFDNSEANQPGIFPGMEEVNEFVESAAQNAPSEGSCSDEVLDAYYAELQLMGSGGTALELVTNASGVFFVPDIYELGVTKNISMLLGDLRNSAEELVNSSDRAF